MVKINKSLSKVKTNQSLGEGKIKKKRFKSKKAKNVASLPAPPDPEVLVLPPKRMSDDPKPKQLKWINRQRVLVFAARGINHRHRHLMEDIKKLMPHHKKEAKMERSKNLFVVNEICEMKNCNKCLMFEGRKMRDLYLWAANIPNGPSAKFLVENIYTMGELKMTGNCLRGSRPLLSFDPQFSTEPHYSLLKELLAQTFGVPNHHPKSQPFFDHVYTFMILDNRIWFRNYQILSEDGALAEIGPRFVLNPVKIFSGSFGGTSLWENPKYVSPAKFRQSLTKKAANRYNNRIEKKAVYEATKPETAYPDMPGSELFRGEPLQQAREALEKAIKSEEASSQDEEESSKEETESASDNETEQSLPVKEVKKTHKKPHMTIKKLHVSTKKLHVANDKETHETKKKLHVENKKEMHEPKKKVHVANKKEVYETNKKSHVANKNEMHETKKKLHVANKKNMHETNKKVAHEMNNKLQGVSKPKVTKAISRKRLNVKSKLIRDQMKKKKMQKK